MGTKIIWFIVAILIVVFGFYAYQHYKENKIADNGGYQCKGCLSPEEEAKFQREDHGETADGQSDHKQQSARQTAADIAANPAATPAQQDTTTNPAPAGQQPTQSMTQPTAQPSPSYTTVSTANNMQMPTTDSQSANAPNGMRFAGSGNYQWYRQGSLTWRVNTSSGQSCIIYATMEEWRKQIVLSHGCGSNS